METIKCPVCFHQTIVNNKRESGECAVCHQAYFYYHEQCYEVCNVRELDGKDISYVLGDWVFEENRPIENYNIEEDKIRE